MEFGVWTRFIADIHLVLDDYFMKIHLELLSTNWFDFEFDVDVWR